MFLCPFQHTRDSDGDVRSAQMSADEPATPPDNLAQRYGTASHRHYLYRTKIATNDDETLTILQCLTDCKEQSLEQWCVQGLGGAPPRQVAPRRAALSCNRSKRIRRNNGLNPITTYHRQQIDTDICILGRTIRTATNWQEKKRSL